MVVVTCGAMVSRWITRGAMGQMDRLCCDGSDGLLVVRWVRWITHDAMGQMDRS